MHTHTHTYIHSLARNSVHDVPPSAHEAFSTHVIDIYTGVCVWVCESEDVYGCVCTSNVFIGVYIQDTHIKCMYDVCIYPYTYLLIYIYICIISMSGCRDEKCSES
jgi:hypothetical protein